MIASDSGVTHIADFDTTALFEKIDLSAWGVTSFGQLSLTQQGSNTLVTDGTYQLIVENIQTNQINHAQYFTLAASGGGGGIVNQAPLFGSGADNVAVVGRAYPYPAKPPLPRQ